MSAFADSRYAHASYADLQELLRRIVQGAFTAGRVCDDEAPALLQRFHPFAFSYELEVLLLAVADHLKTYLGAEDDLAQQYARPAEDQDDETPPKTVLKGLFAKYGKGKYRETQDAPLILSGTTLGELRNSPDLPRFREFLVTLEGVTGVPIQ